MTPPPTNVDDDDRDAVLASVRGDGLALQFASEAHRRDREIVVAAVRHDGRALQFSFFQNDRVVAIEAVRTSADALSFVSIRLRHDVDVVREAVFHHRAAARYALLYDRLDLSRAGPLQARILLSHAEIPYALPSDLILRIVQCMEEGVRMGHQ